MIFHSSTQQGPTKHTPMLIIVEALKEVMVFYSSTQQGPTYCYARDHK